MIVQWCIKGLALDSDEDARRIIDGQDGLHCNWWRRVGQITAPEIRRKLTAQALNSHVNHFQDLDPTTGRSYAEDTPFVSLSAGTIERDTLARTNHVRSARQTALWFGTSFGRRPSAYLYTCWLILAPRQAVGIEGIGEEVRDLNTYRRYSSFQTEGEVAAKIYVPANQIQVCEKWELNPLDDSYGLVWSQRNTQFSPPELLSNIRELI